ncbi:Peptidoglycan/LPS O-acetylase OafA/YrhL, contains acyltransferase and SGNH-hydrolase domains [Parasphingorhabdus marina DSM 22363]|uniref:Peptidoglycan/LPS O-acetylase OafA/YrhL, contains acyltransferase and SGNH-hydrolase domains n=1 Tax=Parasphingorhabdus marina DSM 22363 TaxID=1123272 RepID=A0A1N6H247_9SPHN|nr:acyltransferase [Parasphingorhabdus marina]SIO13737.1 Peptidoglycan/LPS O-acetylase OafA/YrhL, contains acyltransferase and SGNH-hydrolase domains [Parasphingorhabdus marina DSM 22363]
MSRETPGAVDPTLSAGENRLAVLDGWRALCILLVMAGHLLPLNFILPGANEAAGAGGMAIFFVLSGFLITRFLYERPEPVPFLIRRVLRIVPLAWLAMIILYLAQGSARSEADLAANLAFYANLPPTWLIEGGNHLWSLCVEAQFYVGVAVLVALTGRNGLYILPVLALTVTGLRIAAGETISIVTWHRIDEILAGATVALIYLGAFGPRIASLFSRMNFYVAAIIAIVCTYLLYTPFAYARPYAIAMLVGVTLWHAPAWARYLLCSQPAAYIAKISYALYVFHVMLDHTWLGSGELLEKYVKRPLLIAVTFGLAHLSTYQFEQRFINLAKRLTPRAPAPAVATRTST